MNDEFYMNYALQLAAGAVGQTSPNPTVGAVIVRDGEIVGMGVHLKAGEPHAEIHALNMAGSKAEKGTLYVTLEPCSHYGQTPPCTKAVIESGLEKVIIASTDQNSLVAGQGIEKLKQAGIEVVTGLLQEKADQLNEPFFHFIKQRKPYVTVKQAVTLDGKTAAKTGDSKWISGEESRRDVHHDRSLHDAILVGINTVLSDDPRLTNRNEENTRQPIRLILDTFLKVPYTANVVTDGAAPTWIITGSKADPGKAAKLKKKGVFVYAMSTPDLSIEEVLVFLGKKGVMSLYVEGGATVQTSFLKSGHVNRLITYLSPKLIGGEDALGMFNDMEIKTMKEAKHLRFLSVEQMGEDIKIISTLEIG